MIAMKMMGASIGNCVHVGGVVNFLKLAEKHGYQTQFLGPAVPVPKVAEEYEKWKPEIVALSYRLTPETAKKIMLEVKEAKLAGRFGKARLIFGGTPEVSRIASELGIFDWVVTGSETPADLDAWLSGQVAAQPREAFPSTLVERIEKSQPFPIIRHHFGQPSLESTIAGVKRIADARVLDVLSIAPDQNAQEFFFHQEQMKPELDGAGGVPLRNPEHLKAIYDAAKCGNFPILRCYAGTNELTKWAEMLNETIKIAWGAVPLFWYSQLDGRSVRPVETAIKENMETVAWYASHGIPVEVNDSHHWSLRSAPDAVAVASAFLAAFNAKNKGVKTYVAQLMFNTPPGTSPVMDLAKMLAKLELMETLQDKEFHIIREARSGIASLPLDEDAAKGHLGSSIHTMMAVKPHILHVVGYSEANSAATPEVIIESCRIAAGSIRNALLGLPDPLSDSKVVARKDRLVKEAKFLLATIKEHYGELSPNPWIDPKTLAQTVKSGILDAPHLVGNKAGRGETVTKMVDGACDAIDPKTGEVISEEQRLRLLGTL